MAQLGEDALSQALAAVAHPVRRNLLARLRGRASRVTDLAASFDISLPAVSRHLRVLEQAGLVTRSIEGRDHFITASEEGWQGVAGWVECQSAAWSSRLAALKMAKPSLYRAAASVVIRTSPEAAFDAWLDPRQAARFLAANTTVVGAFENDPREGGAFRLVMQDASSEIEHRGRYVVIDRPRRLIFTWVSPGTDHHLSLVTIVFTPVEGGVRVALEHEGLPDEERAGRHERGWASILRKLATLDLSQLEE